MKEIICIANDPGGYDVVYPVYEKLNSYRDFQTILLLSGVSGERHSDYKADRERILEIIADMINNNMLVLLVTGTSWGSDIETSAILMCKKNSITTISILDYWSNYKERFRLNDEYIYPDYFFVMDQIAADEAIAAGIDASIIEVMGSPGLDYYINKRISNCGSNSIVFLSQPLSVLYGDGLGYTEQNAFQDIIKAGAYLNKKVNIKFHSKESDFMIHNFYQYSINDSMEDICRDYENIVGMNTMGLLQCYLLGGKIICYQPGLTGKDMSIVNKLGIVKGAYSYDDLLCRLSENNYEISNNRLIIDGKSTDRVVNRIISILEERG